MSSTAPVRVVIPVHNGAECLEACLKSVWTELRLCDTVIVVDDASTDGSAELVRRHWPDVAIIRSATNLGFGNACNLGAEGASSEVLVFLNQDTVVYPGWLQGLLAAFSFDATVGLASSQQRYLASPDTMHNEGADLHYAGLVFLRNVLKPAEESEGRMKKVHSVVGASFAIRRAVWEELGGFNSVFRMYYEEVDLSWRAELAGYSCLCTPQSVILHDVPRNGVSEFKLRCLCQNRLLSILSIYRWPTLLLLLPGLSLAEVAEFGFAVVAGRWRGVRAKLAAYGGLLRNLGQVGRLRQRNRRLRRVPDWALLQNRIWALEPREFTGGAAGRLLAQVASVPLYANAWLAWRICRLFGW